MLALRIAPAARCARPAAAPAPRPLAPRRALPAALELAQIAAAGDVDAPIGVAVGAAIVVSLIATAIVPIILKPGDDAAQKIFDAKQKKPLDKKPLDKKKR